MKTNDEIFKEILELAQTQEQIQYLTKTNDTIKDGKIETLQRDIGFFQRDNVNLESKARYAENLTLEIIDKLIEKATVRESNCDC